MGQAPATPAERAAFPCKVGDMVRSKRRPNSLPGKVVAIKRRTGTWDGEFVAMVAVHPPNFREPLPATEWDFGWFELVGPKVNPRDGGVLKIGDWVRNLDWGWEGEVVESVTTALGQSVNVSILRSGERYVIEPGGISIRLSATRFEYAERPAE